MSRPLSPTIVTKVVADWFRVKQSLIIGYNRTQHVARARQVSMYLIRQDGRSLTEVGLLFKRNHCSVLAACKRIESLALEDVEFNKDLEQIKHRVQMAHDQAA